MKRFLTLFLTLSLLTSSALSYAPEERDAAQRLFEQGLFYGTDAGFELDRAMNRQEAAAMLVRLLGRETAALSGDYTAGFADVSPWCTGYVGYARMLGLVAGYDDAVFGALDPVTPEQYLSFVLRALGYSDAAGDFRWDDPWDLAVSLGLTESRGGLSAPLTRGGAALVSARALDTLMKGTDTLLNTHLALAEQARQDAALSPAQIYRRAANAVFSLESYETDNPAVPSGTASGFFISADGVAVTNYHALIETGSARITTRDGEVYPVERILYGSIPHDLIVMRVGRTAESGKTVERFPYLELADPSSVRVGDPVYALGAPLGLADTFSDGIISNLSRMAGGRSYFQFTAPISTGSSGGPVLNAFGRVIAVTSATYPNGQNLNLAMPVTALRDVSRDAAGTDYAAYFAGRSYHITADKTQLTLKVGETETVLVGCDYPFTPSLQYENATPFIVSASWGEWTDNSHTQLLLTGVTEGEGELLITYENVKSDAELILRVTVLPADEAPEEDES